MHRKSEIWQQGLYGSHWLLNLKALQYLNEEKLCIFSIRYHLKDVIVGKIYFLLVRIKIKHMEIQIIKRETTGTGKSLTE